MVAGIIIDFVVDRLKLAALDLDNVEFYIERNKRTEGIKDISEQSMLFWKL
jgi:hypothetical protein